MREQAQWLRSELSTTKTGGEKTRQQHQQQQQKKTFTVYQVGLLVVETTKTKRERYVPVRYKVVLRQRLLL
jgi:hypothetical protein